jgi:hypothetical protein
MIERRHIDELESAVRIARQAVAVGLAAEPEPLARLLYARWYLRRLPHHGGSRSPVARPWQTWGPLWTPELDAGGAASVDTVRLDLSIAPPTALHVVAAVTARARHWDHPWRLSSALPGPAPTEADPLPEPTVLHLPTSSLFALRQEVVALVEELAPFLSRVVPALTLRIAHGASLAQEPDDGGTFGQHRSRLVAGAVLDTMRLHHREQVARTIDAFADAGVDPERPYLVRQARWDRDWKAA